MLCHWENIQKSNYQIQFHNYLTLWCFLWTFNLLTINILWCSQYYFWLIITSNNTTFHFICKSRHILLRLTDSQSWRRTKFCLWLDVNRGPLPWDLDTLQSNNLHHLHANHWRIHKTAGECQVLDPYQQPLLAKFVTLYSGFMGYIT